MKLFFYFFISQLISIVYQEKFEYCERTIDNEYFYNSIFKINASSVDDCKNRQIIPELDFDTSGRCCYIYRSKNKTSGYCKQLSSQEYKKLDKFVEYLNLYDEIHYSNESENKNGKIRIDCFSVFLKINILFLILFIL